MRRKTIRKRRNRKKTYRRKIRGGGNQIDACAKYNFKGVNTAMIPMPIKVDTGSPQALSLVSLALSQIPSNDMIILKVGSNDSSAAIKEGSKGKNGVFFIEAPFTAPKGTTTTLIDMRQASNVKQLGAINNALHKTLPSVSAHVISISPETDYYESSWPFVESMNGDDVYKAMIYEHFIQNVKSQKYIQTFFPVALGEKSDPSTKLLDLIVAREGPLVLFNAMGSLCFRSFKYIVDMRKLAGRLTIYMGLVDVADMSSCDLSSQVYPDGDTNCPPK